MTATATRLINTVSGTGMLVWTGRGATASSAVGGVLSSSVCSSDELLVAVALGSAELPAGASAGMSPGGGSEGAIGVRGDSFRSEGGSDSFIGTAGVRVPEWDGPHKRAIHERRLGPIPVLCKRSLVPAAPLHGLNCARGRRSE